MIKYGFLALICFLIPLFAKASNEYEECLSLTREHSSYSLHVRTRNIQTEIAEKKCLIARGQYKNDPKVIHGLGRVYYSKKEYSKAYEYFKKAAELGVVSAYTNIAFMYYDGQVGDKVSYDEYKKWINKAKNMGDPWAYFSIAEDFEFGITVKANYDKAFKHYVKASELGLSDANMNLGKSYAYGWLNLEPDKKKAEDYFFRELELGNPEAKEALALLRYHYASNKFDVINAIEQITGLVNILPENFGNDSLRLYLSIHLNIDEIEKIKSLYEGFEPDQEKAFSILTKYFHDPDLYFWIDAELYSLSLDELSEKNQNTFLKALKKTAENKYSIDIRTSGLSAYIIAKIYDQGLIGPSNIEKAYQYLELGSDLGNASAATDLGWKYQIQGDFEASKKHLLRGAEGSEPLVAAYAYNNLGVLYNNYKPDDVMKRVEYYRKADDIIFDNEFSLSWPAENLSRIYILGKLQSGPDPELALKYAKRAFDQYGSDFFLYILERNDLTKSTTRAEVKNWIEKAILQNKREGLIELAWMAEDDDDLIEALKWFRNCSFLCERDDSKLASEERIEFWKKRLSGRKMKEAEKISRQWIENVWERNFSFDNEIEVTNLNKENSNDEKLRIGNNLAFLIGINDYENLAPLQTPIRDINNLSEILKHKYGFKTEKLENPTRSEILHRLNYYSGILDSDDNFLIYYAGHGIFEAEEGFWLPADAEKENDTNWISNNYLKRKLRSLKSTNTLIVVDSCFSGSLTRGLNLENIRTNQTSPFEIFLKTKSRIVISSGSNEPVFDGGGGGNSVFARVLIDNLNLYQSPFTSMQLYEDMRQKVMKTSISLGDSQTPLYGTLLSSGHEGPDFVFVPVGN